MHEGARPCPCVLCRDRAGMLTLDMNQDGFKIEIPTLSTPLRAGSAARAQQGWDTLGRRFTRSVNMSPRVIAYIGFTTLVLSALAFSQTKNSTTDSDAAISRTLQATERAWLNAEKDHDVGTFRSEEHTSELQSHVNLVCR